MYQLLVEEPDDKEENVEEFTNCLETMEEGQYKKAEVSSDKQPTIYLHALVGTNDFQTMRMKESIKN